MQTSWIGLSRETVSRIFCLVFTFVAALTAGCGSGGGGSSNPSSPSGATTQVTLLVSSAANDQLSAFNIALTGLQLTNTAGEAITVLATSQNAEFIHLNGTSEPLITVSVPQDTYTAATATVGAAQFTCATLNSSGGVDTSTFAYGQTPSNQVMVALPSPIQIAGTAMGLTLAMQVSNSARFDSCVSNGIDPYSINPTFKLTTFDLSSPSGNSGDGNATGMEGLVASVNASTGTFTVTAADGPSWTVRANASTEFQGISGLPALAAGMPIDMDGAVQGDGSIVATRIAVNDAKSANLTVVSGPLLNVASSQPSLISFGREQQGFLTKVTGSQYFSFGNAVFQTSGALANLQSLPFPPSFTAANMVAGQNLSITTHATAIAAGPIYFPATTVTLMPQTIDGTITAVASSGAFDMYTIQLATYDAMPTFAAQQGQTTLLAHPDTVVVYVDHNTRMRNATALETGIVFRFSGLLFNDHGILRMDCAQVNDGVTV